MMPPFPIDQELLYEEPDGFRIVQHHKILHQSRWSVRKRYVVTDDDQHFWAIEFSEGSTEMQDADPAIVVYPVAAYQVTEYFEI